MTAPIVTVFRSRLRDDRADGYEDTAEEMERRARSMPGFVDFKQFVADDGERLSLIAFADRDSHDAWRDDPDHRVTQQRGRQDWYAEYTIQVCEQLVTRTFVHHR